MRHIGVRGLAGLDVLVGLNLPLGAQLGRFSHNLDFRREFDRQPFVHELIGGHEAR